MSEQKTTDSTVSDRQLLLMNCALLGAIESSILLYTAGWKWMLVGALIAACVVGAGHMSTRAENPE